MDDASGKPKILHAITRMDRGGSAQNTLLTCIGLAHRYDTVLVFGPTTESNMSRAQQDVVDAELRRAGLAGVRILTMGALYRRINPALDAAALWGLLRVIRRERPDIVHTHTSKAGLLGRAAARLCNVPAVVHTPHGHVFSGHFDSLSSRVFLGVEKALAPLCHHLVAISDGEREDMVRLGVCREQRISVIHSGVDLAPYLSGGDKGRARQLLGIPEESLVVGCVGWLMHVKGPDLLLDAASELCEAEPRARLVFVGDGPMRRRLEARALQHGIGDRIVFAGWREDVPDILPAFDVLALPSRNEGMGRVLVEAMASGLPVVATRVGGVPDLVVKGETGVLVPPENPQALAKALLHLLRDREAAAAMGQRGREHCRRFGLEAMLDALDRLYRTLLEETRAKAGSRK
ncbi:MAG: glycosyltransferase family 4 protein [Desulfatibacillaceae bacterium]